MNDFQLSPYSITFLSAFVLAYIIDYFVLVKRAVPKRYIGYSLFLNTFLIIYGSRMYGVIVSGFKKNIFESGTASIGGLIGLILGTITIGLICKNERKFFFEAYILTIPLMYGISKLGCHFVGCCHGINYDRSFAVSYNNAVTVGGPYFPVQLTESIVFTCIFILCAILYLAFDFKYHIPLVLGLCALAKFSLEYLREEHVGVFLSPNQLVCIMFFIIAIILSVKIKVKK